MELSERSPKKAAKIARDALRQGQAARQSRRAHVLRGRRHLARARPAAHAPAQYPMHVMHNYVIPSRDALEFAKLVERIEADALLSIESVVVRAPAVARLWRGGAGGDHPPGQSEGNRHLRARRARGDALREPVARGAGAGSADRRGARVQRLALARARPCRGAVRLDQPVPRRRAISRRRRRRRGCATPPACSPTSPGAPIPTIAASNPTI